MEHQSLCLWYFRTDVQPTVQLHNIMITQHVRTATAWLQTPHAKFTTTYMHDTESNKNFTTSLNVKHVWIPSKTLHCAALQCSQDPDIIHMCGFPQFTLYYDR